MNLTILNKTTFCQKFLKPISMVSDICVLQLSTDKITTTCKKQESNTALHAISFDILYKGDDVNLNIGDLKKLIKLLDCIPDETVDLVLNSNNIEYRSRKTKFKLHLIEDGIISNSTINIQLLESTGFDISFEISVERFNFLLKSSTFTNTNKVYVYTKDGSVFGDLDDKSQMNIDTFGCELSDAFNGSQIEEAIPFSIELFRCVSVLKSSALKTRINKKRKLVVFDVGDGNYSLKYVSTAMVN